MKHLRPIISKPLLLWIGLTAGALAPLRAVELRLETPGGVLPYESPLTFRWSFTGQAGSYVIRVLTGPPANRQELWASSRIGGDRRSLSVPLPFAARPDGQLVWLLEAYNGDRLVARGAKLFSFAEKPSPKPLLSWLEQISELRTPPSVLYAPHGRIPPASEIEFIWSDSETPHHFVVRVLEERLDAAELEPREIWTSGEVPGTERTLRVPLTLSDAATSRYSWTLDVYKQAGERASRSAAQSFSVLTSAEQAELRQRESLFASWEMKGGETRHILLLRAATAAASDLFGEARRSLSRFLALQDDRDLSFKALTTLVAKELRKTEEKRDRLLERFHAATSDAEKDMALGQIGDADLLLLDYDGALGAYRALLERTPPGPAYRQLEARMAQAIREQDLQRSIFGLAPSS